MNSSEEVKVLGKVVDESDEFCLKHAAIAGSTNVDGLAPVFGFDQYIPSSSPGKLTDTCMEIT